MRLRALVTIAAFSLAAPLIGCSTGDDTTRTDEQAEAEQPADQPRAERDDQRQRGEMADEEMTQEERERARGGGPQDEDRREKMREFQENCPMALDGTEVEYEETDQGAAMRFTTDEDVDELRDRVQWMADQHNEMVEKHQEKMDQMDEDGRMPRQDNERGDKEMKKMKTMLEAHAQAEQTDDGARLIFTARDDGDVDDLRDSVEEQAEMFDQRGCPMMEKKEGDEMHDDDHMDDRDDMDY